MDVEKRKRGGPLRRWLRILAVLGLGLVPAGNAVAAEAAVAWVGAPVLVSQSVYPGMTFYVGRPMGIPQGWYATYDGYAVALASSGVWYYGSFVGGAVVPTAYVVGAVVPTAVPIVPYVSFAAPVSLQPSAPAAPPAPPVPMAVQPMSPPVTYVPAWMMNSGFCSISRWRVTVDRMAIMDKPRVPLAWKGRTPEVIYAWTGSSWYQMLLRDGEEPKDVLARNMYALVRMTGANGARWNDADTPILANQAAMWGYLWLGRIAPVR